MIKYFPNKPSSKTWLNCRLPLLTQQGSEGTKCRCYLYIRPKQKVFPITLPYLVLSSTLKFLFQSY